MQMTGTTNEKTDAPTSVFPIHNKETSPPIFGQLAAQGKPVALATIFPDIHCRRVEKTLATWPDVCAVLAAPLTEAVKKEGRLLSLAQFGTKTTAKGSLKHDENIVSAHGLVGDYDAGTMPISEARALLEKAGVKAIFYPSWGDGLVDPPKYNGGPRWRVVAPFSQALAPAEYPRMMARLNGALGGVLAPESFTVAQGYFFGKRPGATFECYITFNDPAAGACVDELPALDAVAIGKAEKATAPENDAAGARGDGVAEWVKGILTGDTYHTNLLALSASLIAGGARPEAAQSHLDALMDASAGEHDERWRDRKRQIPDLIASAVHKFGQVSFDEVLEQAKTAPERRYKLLGSAALAALPPLAWRVRGVLPEQGLAAIYGPSGSGKSFLAIDLCAAIARGRPWFDKHVTGAPVVYLALEGEAGIRLRVQAWEKHHQEKLPDGLNFILEPFDLTSQQDLANLLAVLPRGGVCIIDTLNRAAPGLDENASKDMGQVLKAAKTIQAQTAGLVVLVHHTGKDAGKGLRGHSSLFAAMDAVIEVERAPGLRSWRVGKAKDGEDGASYTFDQKIVDVGQDEDGFSETSCVIVPAMADVVKPKLTPMQEVAFASFDAVDLGLGVVARNDWRLEFFDRMGDRAQEAKRKAFTRASTALVSGGYLSQKGEFFANVSPF